MGYRLRLGRFPKTVWEYEIKGKPYDEVVKFFKGVIERNPDIDTDWDEHYQALYRPPLHVELYELGKHVNFPEGRSPFYSFDLEEDEFEIMSKEGLKAIILDYHKNIKEFYKGRFESLGGEKTLDNNARNILRDKRRKYHQVDKFVFHDVLCDYYGKVSEWDSKWTVPYYLDEPYKETDGALVRSWKFEYAIFNLVHIYRTFDWERDLLIYNGW